MASLSDLLIETILAVKENKILIENAESISRMSQVIINGAKVEADLEKNTNRRVTGGFIDAMSKELPHKESEQPSVKVPLPASFSKPKLLEK